MTDLHGSLLLPQPRLHPFQLALRALGVAGVLVALAATRAAGSDTLLVLEVGIIGLALLSAVLPDTHLGLLIVLLAGSHWLAIVDDVTTPWAMGFATGIALAHTSMGAASVSPPAARWSEAMRRRWARRLLTQIAVIVPTWAVVATMAEIDIGANAIVMAGALLVVAVVGLWARHGALERDPPGNAHGTR
jgi:hypothetical protein